MTICAVSSNGKKTGEWKLTNCTAQLDELIVELNRPIQAVVEATSSWYWLADLCQREGINFILGHALYMKSIHGVKTKNDRIDSLKIARLIRGGNFPIAYVYSPGMRATRDLMRRRTHFVRKRAELLAHIQNTTTQYNLDPLGSLSHPDRRRGKEIVGHFPNPVV